LITLTNLEEFVLEEAKLREGGLEAKVLEEFPGRLLVSGATAEELASMRTVESVVELLDEMPVESLSYKDLRKAFREKLRSSEALKEFFSSIDTLTVVTRVSEAWASEAVLARIFSREVKRVFEHVKLKPKGASSTLWVELSLSKCLIGNLKAKGLHNRSYTAYRHRAMLNPIIASSMVLMTGVSRSSWICDPFAGAGTIPIEACLLGFEKAWASDISLESVKGSALNAERAGVDGRVDVLLADFKALPRGREVGAVVTDPPRGLRTYAREDILKLYYRLFRVLEKTDFVTAVLVTPYLNLLKKALGLFKRLELERVVATLQGGQEVFLVKLSKGGARNA